MRVHFILYFTFIVFSCNKPENKSSRLSQLSVFDKDRNFEKLFYDSLSKDIEYFNQYADQQNGMENLAFLFPKESSPKLNVFYAMVALDEAPIWNISDSADRYRLIIMERDKPIVSIALINNKKNKWSLVLKRTDGLVPYYSGNLTAKYELIFDQRKINSLKKFINLISNVARIKEPDIDLIHPNWLILEEKTNGKYILFQRSGQLKEIKDIMSVLKELVGSGPDCYW